MHLLSEHRPAVQKKAASHNGHERISLLPSLPRVKHGGNTGSRCKRNTWVFSIYKKFRKISIGNSGNFRLGKERSICHKSHSFTSPSPSLHQKTRCVGKLFCYFRERVFFRRFPVKQMLIIGMCGYEKSDICMFPSF